MKHLFLVSAKEFTGKPEDLFSKFNCKQTLFWPYTRPLLFTYIPVRYRFIINI